ncbi:glycosyl hydrolase family 26 [Geodermatophilus tzadiensis]|uniref:Glycosyl hydrolase family 26 n=1 Tax=Geodermatophilus tzadiensis TaxID=1137988 RepID=A0A2T0ST73_9ACTN|nr:glycosyl hydrolase [Geodermatophilus tzadiensis]PRY36598.1 glycosyl hydrolase family 26 [Geodermatophilus tzadiensis]
MEPVHPGVGVTRRLPLLAVAAALLTGCAVVPQEAAPPVPCDPTPAAAVVPGDGVYLGANLDWGSETLAEYAAAAGHAPAVAVSFTGFPLGPDDGRNLDGAVDQLVAQGGLMLLTLEPHDGLAAVTDDAAADLAARLDGYNRRGVPVVVRFAHEMNGSWYAWGQQPAEYVAAFRRVAAAVHAEAPGSATMWAPNYGGGYPFAGGRYEAVAGSGDAAVLDTDGDGGVTAADDPYAPYWPGDDAVDWVGMSLYHWGSAHPWGENEVPEPGKFVAQLTGEYVGLAGDDRGLPDFHGTYGVQHGKPVAVPETAALYAPGSGGADELAVKQAWWRQVHDPALAQRLPRLAMVNWFEWDKDEPEIGGRVDWTAASGADTRAAYRADLPAWGRWADAVPSCD